MLSLNSQKPASYGQLTLRPDSVLFPEIPNQDGADIADFYSQCCCWVSFATSIETSGPFFLVLREFHSW